MTKQQTEALIEWQHNAGLPHPPTPFTIIYRQAIQGQGERAYDWQDKPHRLVFDLCREMERIAATPSPAPSGTLEGREAIARIKAALVDADNLDSIGVMVKSADLHAILALSLPAREVSGEPWAWGWYERGGTKRAHAYLPTVDYPREPECDPFPLYRAEALATTPAPREMEADLAALLAVRDKKASECPDKELDADKDCPRCGATSNEGCRITVLADAAFVHNVRATLAKLDRSA